MFFYNIYRTNVFNNNHSKIRIKTTRSNLLNESREIKFTISVKQRNSSPCEKDNLKKRKLIVPRLDWMKFSKFPGISGGVEIFKSFAARERHEGNRVSMVSG